MRREVPAEHIVAYEIGPFMHVHADSVANAVREVLESWPVAAIDDDLARGGIYIGCWHSGTSRLERGGLCASHEVEDRLHLVRRLAKNESSSDVRGVALDFAAVVEH